MPDYGPFELGDIVKLGRDTGRIITYEEALKLDPHGHVQFFAESTKLFGDDFIWIDRGLLPNQSYEGDRCVGNSNHNNFTLIRKRPKLDEVKSICDNLEWR